MARYQVAGPSRVYYQGLYYNAGDVLEMAPEEAAPWLEIGDLVKPGGKATPTPEPEENAPQEPTESAGFPKKAGGSWYVLSDGSKVQGKANAEKAQAGLEG